MHDSMHLCRPVEEAAQSPSASEPFLPLLTLYFDLPVFKISFNIVVNIKIFLPTSQNGWENLH